MISQNTSETLKISRAGTTFCGKKNGGVKHPSGVTQLVKTLRTSRWIRVAKITTSSHPTNGWEVVGKDSGGREFEYFGLVEDRKVAWPPKACHRYAKLSLFCG
jgi:hypothetical protein